MSIINNIQSKLVTQSQLDSVLSVWRFKNQKVVFTNGCFDVLHRGHVEYLAQAAQLGTKLIIGLNTDTSVSRIKGPNRPINDQNSRAMVLGSLFFVDAIVFFDDDTPLNLIKQVMPNFLVKGADYKIEDIVGYNEVTSNGGQVVTISFVDGFSSTSIIKKSGLM